MRYTLLLISAILAGIPLGLHGCKDGSTPVSTTSTATAAFEEAIPHFSFPLTLVQVQRDNGAIVVLSVQDEHIDAQDIRQIAKMRELKILKFIICRMDPQAIESLVELKQIGGLQFDGVRIGDKDTQVFQQMPKLTALSLVRTEISDQSIDALLKCGHLTGLDVSFTHITPAGLERLKHGLPGVQINATGISD